MSAVAAAPGLRMPLTDHLREARTRLIRAAVALAVGTVLGFLLSGAILDVLRAPVTELAQSRNASLNYDTVTGAFDLRLRIALIAGLAFSAPLWCFELLAFAAPGLSRTEKRHAFGFLAAALPLFILGCAVGLLLFGHMVQVLTGFAAAEDSTLLAASGYFDFVLQLVVATGLAFTLPVAVVALNFLGLLPARAIARSWRVGVIAIVVVSALVTPAADVLSMFLIAVPMTALFFGAYLVAALHDRRSAARCSA